MVSELMSTKAAAFLRPPSSERNTATSKPNSSRTEGVASQESVQSLYTSFTQGSQKEEQQAKSEVSQEGDEEIEDALNQLNDFVQQSRRELRFSVDKDSGRTVIKVIEPESGETIRQIPREEMLALSRAHRANEKGQGLLLSEKV